MGNILIVDSAYSPIPQRTPSRDISSEGPNYKGFLSH